MLNKSIIFFNQGSKICSEFIALPNRENFFWYCDKFFSHFSIKQQERYLHLFIKNPVKDNIDFIFMQSNNSWEDVFTFFKGFNKRHKGYDLAQNPPILRSFNTLIPDIIFDFEKEGNKEAVVIFPESLKGNKVRFFDENHFPRKFKDIPELVELLPEIENCYFP